MHVEIPHNFSKEAARKRVEDALAQSRGQLVEHAPDLHTAWEGETLAFGASIQGKRIDGTLKIEDKQFVLDAKLPLLWRMFEGRIEQAIKDQVAQLR